MRFNPWCDQETCSKPTAYEESDDLYACCRVAGHEGECAPVVLVAARLDGVCFYCREKKGTPHHARCPRAT